MARPHWYGDGFPRHVTVSERRAQAAQEAHVLRRQGRELKPVVIEGHAIAKTFWGKAWCEHLESYSDYASRLPRGRSYARNGSVIDLQLGPGRVRALVSGTSVYEIAIDVTPLVKPRWKALVARCVGQLDSVVELLSGRMPDAVMQVLCDRDTGLFPAARELKLSCSCPDSAVLCKHLAAVLYGIGARLDREPELLFVLREVDQLELIGGAGSALVARRGGVAELDRSELEDIFGIVLDKGGPKKKGKAARRKEPRRQRRAR